jgi:hypothetical protein
MIAASFCLGFICGAAMLAFVALRLSKPKQAETPRFTGPIGLGGGADPLSPHVAYQIKRIFSDLERGIS